MFYIGSEEQLQGVLENHLLKFIIAKFLRSFVVALIWSVIAYFHTGYSFRMTNIKSQPGTFLFIP